MLIWTLITSIYLIHSLVNCCQTDYIFIVWKAVYNRHIFINILEICDPIILRYFIEI